jgi:hypothetical protein
MPLIQEQIEELAEAIHGNWDLEKLGLFTSLLEYNLKNEVTTGSVKFRALKFISDMNSRQPPHDHQMLGKLANLTDPLLQNEELQTLAKNLLEPPFISTNGNDPYYAIVLGKPAFLDRKYLRDEIPEFTNPGKDTTRVLIVRGEKPGGKSHTYFFLQHLAFNVAGARFHSINLVDSKPDPRQLFKDVGSELRFDLSDNVFPKIKDDPQEAKLQSYGSWLGGQIDTLQEPHWLVIDDLNHPEVTEPAREAAYELAKQAEIKKGNLWVALLGYNKPITDDKLEYIAEDEARFPNRESIIEYFCLLSNRGGLNVEKIEAGTWIDLLCNNMASLDKEGMKNLKKKIEKLGKRLLKGKKPQVAAQ